jgi:hypothetical protein
MLRDKRIEVMDDSPMTKGGKRPSFGLISGGMMAKRGSSGGRLKLGEIIKLSPFAMLGTAKGGSV